MVKLWNPFRMTDELPRLLARNQAAMYLGVSLSTFSAWVKAGYLPPPVFNSKQWDRRGIDAWLDRESGIASNPVETVYQKRKRERAAEETPYQKWKRENGR